MSSTYNVGGRVVRRGPVSVKEGGGLASWIWSTKWLVLKEMVLTLHKSESSLTPQSVIPLSEITHLERTDLRTHCLLLETQDRKRFFLSLQNDDELYGWQDDISFLSPFSGVSQPTNFVHRVHVGYDPVSKKYTGLPDQWKKLLENESVITRDYSKYPQAVLDVLKFYTDHQERNLEREIDSGAGNDYSTDPQALLDVIDVYKARKTEELHREIDSTPLLPPKAEQPFIPPNAHIPFIPPNMPGPMFGSHPDINIGKLTSGASARTPPSPDQDMSGPTLTSSSPYSPIRPTQQKQGLPRPLPVKTKTTPSAARPLPQSPPDADPPRDLMSPVDTIVYNHEQRAALLTQGLPPSDLRNALQSCYQHISAALLTVLDSRDAKNTVLLLEGDRAQSFLDAVQDVLDKGSLPSAQHTSQARRLILRLSEARDRLPSSLFITGVTDYDEHPTFCGGFGDIYRASHNDSTVAVKRIRMFSSADSQRTRLQFCREALVWQTLQHKYVLPLIGIDRESFTSSFCLVSPWMKHGTVLKYLSEHGREDVDKLLLQVAEGLEYLHSMNIVHGDLRGTNILVSDDWNACLADFGLTTITDATSTTSAALTSTAHHAGSARWFAPELIQPTSFGCEKFQRTPASDVYAFACVCLELHTGRPPFSGISPDVAAMLKVIAGERPAQPDASMSDGLWELVSAAWAQNFRDRPNIETIIQSMRTLNG